MLSISVAALIWLVSLRTLSTALDPTVEGTWRDWKATHGKEYAQEEESFRRAMWEKNLQMIQDHNKQADLGKYTYWLGMNHFGDLTNEELDKRLHCLLSDVDKVTKGNRITFKSSDDPDIPDQIDWRTKGGVTEVKDQGSCGSCWSFSATGALEGMHFKKTGKLVSLSEQNLLDCSKENYGCDGGIMELAFETVRKQGGINSEKSYPYDGTDGESCRYEPEESITRCNSFGQIMENDEKGLQEAVAKIGPVSVGVDARSSKFHFYKSGIFGEHNNGKQELTHAMLIVGYNHSSEGKGYWILKNSWSTLWGEKGYMRLAKGSNQCNVAEHAVFPIPDPKKGK
ncbi:procathepsin L-like isoform X2 [Pantherophis guttatus]|uniref:Procathepsin L-like isoform X2 n=1 Tax=Pantherophis guttatus TaxID=94885 RepID=A0ABM3YNH0_PANGU|nr:procathepsin L-like isoform X2 [Pantherophis guttatus]